MANPSGSSTPKGPSEVRQPSVVSAGLAVQASTRLLLTGQLDYVRYGEIETPS